MRILPLSEVVVLAEARSLHMSVACVSSLLVTNCRCQKKEH